VITIIKKAKTEIHYANLDSMVGLYVVVEKQYGPIVENRG
jgi:hypothetical protein